MLALIGGVIFWLVSCLALPGLARIYERRADLPAPIWRQTPCIDAVAAAVTTWLLTALPPQHAAPALAVSFSLYAATRFDRAMQVIPDALQILGAVGAVAWRWQSCGAHGPDGLIATGIIACMWAIGMAVCSYGYERWHGGCAMGLGDIKMLAWLILIPDMEPTLLLAGAFALAWLWLLPALLWRRLKWREAFAFGPFLALAAAALIIVSLLTVGGISWAL